MQIQRCDGKGCTAEYEGAPDLRRPHPGFSLPEGWTYLELGGERDHPAAVKTDRMDKLLKVGRGPVTQCSFVFCPNCSRVPANLPE